MIRSRHVAMLLCLAALAGFTLRPNTSRAVDFNISGSAQLDYFFGGEEGVSAFRGKRDSIPDLVDARGGNKPLHRHRRDFLPDRHIAYVEASAIRVHFTTPRAAPAAPRPDRVERPLRWRGCG